MKRTFASDAIKLSLAKIMTRVIQMIIAMILSRLLSLEEYGTYSQIMIVVTLFTTIFMFGLPNCINYFLPKLNSLEEEQKFISVYYTVSSGFSLLTGIMLVIFTPMICEYFDNGMIGNFKYVLFFLPWVRIILAGMEHIFIVKRKANCLLLFKLLNSICMLAIIALVYYCKLGFDHYMMLYIIVGILFALSVYFIVYRIFKRVHVDFERDMVLEIFKFSIPIGLASVVGTLSIQLDKLLIGKFFSTEQIAIYSNAAKELPVTIIASALTAVLMPRVVRMLKEGKNEEAVELWGKTAVISYAVIAFFSSVLFVFAPEVITILYSEKYLPGIGVFRIYSLVLLIRFTYFGIVLNSTGRTKFIFFSSIVSLLLNVVLNYIFYLFIGFKGPAIATLISLLVVALMQLLVTSKCIKITFKKILPWKELGFITIVNLILSPILMSLYNMDFIGSLGRGYIRMGIILVIWSGMYYVIIFKKIKRQWLKLKKEK